MHKTEQTNIESLLGQLELHEPSSELDQVIFDLAAIAKPVQRKPNFNWILVGVSAGIAALIGLAIGVGTFSNQLDGDVIARSNLTDVSEEFETFQTMHGHSGNMKFQNCADCHVFANKKNQEIVKWVFDLAVEHTRDLAVNHAHKFGSNCSLCHLGQAELDGE